MKPEITPLPFYFPSLDLNETDFYRHEPLLCRTIREIFTCREVAIAHIIESNGTVRPLDINEWPETVKTGIDLVLKERRVIINNESQSAFLPLTIDREPIIVAVIIGGPPTLYANSPSWFIERGRQIRRELHLIKTWSMDPMSGLLNAAHLRQKINFLINPTSRPNWLPPVNQEANGQLLLIETAHRGQDADQALANISQTGAYLDSLLGGISTLHHLGAGIFALPCPGTNEPEAQKLGYSILRKLKRHNIIKAHIGIAPISPTEQDIKSETDCPPLSQAWQALRTAKKRGAFALCSSAALNPENNQLPPIDPEIMSAIKNIWRGVNQFSIILLKRDIARDTPFPERLLSLMGPDAVAIPAGTEKYIIYLAGLDDQEAEQWAHNLSARLKKLQIGTFSQGIACYPCPGFKKIDTPMNAAKALAHASFYGPGAITTFDSVSLNISGDIYYNEGDINSAIREYRLGLNLNPDNINLLNSLGVIYAQIERYKMAIPLFEQITAIKPRDFMALFNLGFAHLRGADNVTALKYFEKALTVDDSCFDLLLQLGQLYCTQGQYKKAIKVLRRAEGEAAGHTREDNHPWEYCEPWLESGNDLGHDQVYRYLGQALRGEGQYREAITCLQRAIASNNRDALSLSMLGELYAMEKQGINIAVDLCRQAVELNNEEAGNWRRLAWVLSEAGSIDEAIDAVRRALDLAPRDTDILLLAATLYKSADRLSEARAILARLLKIHGTNQKAAQLLKQINRLN
ncbi:MAG TPA: tetratricopeptide repeat protein [Desulfobacterales bacterium]|nr:tetratricopeptide repeat protein [Desulfobacterales bacterium]